MSSRTAPQAAAHTAGEIAIHTLLDGRLFSSGVDQERRYDVCAATPRNLLRVVRGFRAHCREMDDCYGNIGHRTSWLVVNGVEIDWWDIGTLDDARHVLAWTRTVRSEDEDAEN